MTPLSERIAGVSLTTIVLLLCLLTMLRAGLVRSRANLARSTADLLESVILAITLVFLLLRPFLVQSFFIPSGSMHPTLWEGDHILVNKWVFRFAPPKRGDIIVFRAPQQAAPDEKDFIKRVVGVANDVIEVREGFVMVGRGANAQFLTRDAVLARLCPNGRPISVDEELQGKAEPDSGTSTEAPPLHLRLTTDALWLGERRITPEEFATMVGSPGAPVTIQPGRVLRNGEVLIEPYVTEDPQYHMDPVTVPQGHLFVMGDNRNDSRDSHVWGTFPAKRVVGRADLVFWPLAHLKRVPGGE